MYVVCIEIWYTLGSHWSKNSNIFFWNTEDNYKWRTFIGLLLHVAPRPLTAAYNFPIHGALIIPITNLPLIVRPTEIETKGFLKK